MKQFYQIIIIVILTGSFVLKAASSQKLTFNPRQSSFELNNKDEEVLNILAVRVNFQPDTLKSTTGNGKIVDGSISSELNYDESEYPDSIKIGDEYFTIDAKPHNKKYFEDKLDFVEQYFSKVSHGKVRFDEKPLVLDSVLTLPFPMWYYNPNSDDPDVNDSLLTLLHTTIWETVATWQDVDFSKYNSFVVFHAGSGQEFSPEANETFFDIPSVYFSEKELREGDNIITAHDGTEITNGIILPECEWQRSGDDWYFAGMGGVSVLMFAHKLGLPNLYSHKSGKSGVGRFDPMDQGSGNFYGLIPAGPSAWVKEYKGWAEVRTIDKPTENIEIVANDTIYRIDIDENEYLLLENRQSHTSIDLGNDLPTSSCYGYSAEGDTVARFYYDTKAWTEKIEIIDPTKVMTSVDNYDYAVPASGILVWHIDKRKTSVSQIENNEVNNDWDNRGVYLEEADGSFDIGEDYWLLDAGYGTEYGSAFDAFYNGNEAWIAANRGAGLNRVEFSSLSYPRSDLNENINSGIKLYNFSAVADTMSFSYTKENLGEVTVINTELVDPQKYINVRYEGKSWQLSADYAGNFFAYNFTDGSSNSFTNEDLVGDELEKYRFSAFEDKVIIFTQYDEAADSTAYFVYDLGQAELSSRKSISGKITASPVYRTAQTTTGLTIFDNNFEQKVFVPELKGALAYSVAYDEDGQIEYIVNSLAGKIVVAPFDENELLSGTPEEEIISSFSGEDAVQLIRELDGGVFGLIDPLFNHGIISISNDDSVEMNFNLNGYGFGGYNDYNSDGVIDALGFNRNGITIENNNGFASNGFPVLLDRGYENKNDIFSYNNAGEKFIVAVDNTGLVDVIDGKGNKQKKLNLVIPGKTHSLISLTEAEGGIYLTALDRSNGNIYNYSLGSGTINLATDFNQKMGNKFNNKYLIMQSAAEQNSGDKIIRNGNVYNYPNPASGDLTKFRFFLNKATEVSIKVYDINGNRVANFKRTISAANGYYEIPWDLKEIASGIYLARVEFSSGGKSEQYTVKVAVSR